MSDVFNILKDLIPLWLAVIATGLIALVILYVKMFMKQNDFAKDQSAFLKERIEVIGKSTEIFEKTIQRQNINLDALNIENEKLKEQLTNANIDPQSYYIENVVVNGNDELKSKIKTMTDKIETLMQKNSDDNFELHLSLANAYAVNEDWKKSAEQFEIVTRLKNTSWELYFSQGIAFANSRMGRESHFKALQSYSSAIVFLPDEIDNNIKARLYIYKGAMLKRLNRIKEAEYNIKLGLEYAVNKYEITDGLYNLSCVYAIQNEKDKYYKISTELENKDSRIYAYLLKRLDEYAPEFKKELEKP
jgi:hypothetical protein